MPAVLYAFPRTPFGLAGTFSYALRDLLLKLRPALVYLLLDALPALIHLFFRPLADLFFDPSACHRARKRDEGDHEEDEELLPHACPSCLGNLRYEPLPPARPPETPVPGVKPTIDDPGGQGNWLSPSGRLPVGFLEMDRSVIDGLGRNPEDAAVTCAFMGLADASGIGVIAQGIENSDPICRPLAPAYPGSG